MEFTFLGTGTSQGIPMIACDCAVCKSTDPRDKRLRSSVHLQAGGLALQIDTTPDFRTQCLRENIRQVDAVLLTHSHSDHILGFDDLRRFCEIENCEMPVYGSPATLRNLRRIFYYAFCKHCTPTYSTYVRPLAIPMTEPFLLGNLRVTPVDLPHGRMTTTGLVFQESGKKFAYYTDCSAVPDAARNVARDCDCLVIGALRHRVHSTHLSLEQAIEIARDIGSKRTFFTHICHEVSHATTDPTLPETMNLAYDGLHVKV